MADAKEIIDKIDEFEARQNTILSAWANDKEKETHTDDLEWSYISEFNAMMLEEIKDHVMIEKEATNDDRVVEWQNRLMN